MTKAFSFTRLSTPQQQRGDSVRRQLKKAADWAEARGIPLDTSLRSIGISAFKGVHRTKGALAAFLNRIRDGEITFGSYLIVENVDRLSRENPWDAIGLMREIINSGVIVISLIDDMEYSLEALRKSPSLMQTLQAALTKGYRESADKADRLQEAWNEKRAQIVAGGRKKLTRQGPGWFSLVPDDPSEPLVGDWHFTDHKASGRTAYDWCIAGLGKEAIARKLNRLDVPTFKKGDGWQASTVHMLLTDRRAIGELQLYSRSATGKREPIGEPIKGYYATDEGETLVSEETFYLAQAALAKRHCGAGVGRRGKVPNLFVGLARCSCGRSLEFKNKHSRYLICSGAQRHRQCLNDFRYPYEATEALVLDWVTDIRLPDNDVDRAGRLQITLSAKFAEREDLTRRVREAIASWESTTVALVKDELMRSAERNAQARDAVEREIADLRAQAATQGQRALADRKATIARVREEMAHLDDENLFEARAKLAAALRHVIDHVEFGEANSFTVFLHGSVKAYHFKNNAFRHLIDVGESSWMRLPTFEQKKKRPDFFLCASHA